MADDRLPASAWLCVQDKTPPEPYLEALQAEGIAPRLLPDIFALTGTLEPGLAGGAPPTLIGLLGGPAPVLRLAVAGVRAGPLGWGVRVLVASGELGLNERGALLRAGTDDCQSSRLDPTVFAARARALLRRAAAPGDENPDCRRSLGPIRLELLQRSARLGETPLRLTRLQFDLLLELARAGGKPAPPEQLAARLRTRGHELDAAGLLIRLHTLNQELMPCAWMIDTVPGAGCVLREASAEQRVPVLALGLLQALSTLTTNLALYRGDHPGIVSCSERAEQCVGQIAALTGSDHVTLSYEDGALTANGRAPDTSAPAPPPVLQFLVSFRVRELRFAKATPRGEFVALARLMRLGPGEAYPSQLPGLLAERGARSIAIRTR